MPIPAPVLAGLDSIAPLPVTASKLLTLMGRAEVSLNEVASVLEFDQVVAARVLRLARSAAYAGRIPASDVREAVMRLGAATVLELVLGESLRAMETDTAMYQLAEDELWAHGAASALAVRAIELECPVSPLPRLTHTAALVHDIGKLVLVRVLQVGPAAVANACAERNITWIEAERELFGCDHAEVGAELATRWKFPDEVIAAIARHHDVPQKDPTPLVDAVVAANLAAKSIGVGLGAEGLNLHIDAGVAARLHLDFARFSRVCMQTSVWLKDLRNAA